MSRARTWRSNTAGRKVRTYPLLLKGARDHAPSHDVEHGDCENGQLRITRNAPDRHCDQGRYDCDDDFGLDFGHGDGPLSGGRPGGRCRWATRSHLPRPTQIVRTNHGKKEPLAEFFLDFLPAQSANIGGALLTSGGLGALRPRPLKAPGMSRADGRKTL